MGQVIVEVLDGRGAVRHRVDVIALPATIGRAYDSAVVLDDPYVDPVHARIVASDGWVAIEDAGSTNGIRASRGEAAARVNVVSGDTVRVGRTVLRFVDPSRPLAPTLADAQRTTTGASWATQPVVAWSVLIATTVLIVVGELWAADNRPVTSTVLSLLLGWFLLLGVWAGIWAVINRIVVHRFRFLAHMAIGSLAGAIAILFGQTEAFVGFLFPASAMAAILGIVAEVTAIGVPIALHLALVSTLSRAKRWSIALAFGAAIGAMTVASQVIDHRKFSTTPTVAARLEPLPASWIPAQAPDTFFTEVRRLRTRVDAMAAERP
jgi:pSer/pThr/pTyr-binding forkhead associated (FHA) protein